MHPLLLTILWPCRRPPSRPRSTGVSSRSVFVASTAVRRLRSGLELPVAGRVSSWFPPTTTRVIGDLVRTILAHATSIWNSWWRSTGAPIRPVSRSSGRPRATRLTVVEIEACPDDWAGKCHAAARGAEAATGDWLVFTDADVHFDPDAIRAAVAIADHERVDLLSAFTNLTGRSWWHAVVQPPAAVTLLRMFPPDRVNDEARPRSFANGQFMLFSRESYERIGGHEAVKGAVLEDLAFATAVHEFDGRIRVVRRDDRHRHVRIAGRVLSGWRRIYIESAKRNLRRLSHNAILVFGSGLAPLGCWGRSSRGGGQHVDGRRRLGNHRDRDGSPRTRRGDRRFPRSSGAAGSRGGASCSGRWAAC